MIFLLRTSGRALRHRKHVFKRNALAYDLDPEGDYMKPGNTPPERAYMLLLCGYDLLLSIANSGIPSLDRRTRRRGKKWMHEMFLYFASQPTQLLSHAIPTLYAAMGGRLGETGEGEGEALEPGYHLALERALEDFYPLPVRLAADIVTTDDEKEERKRMQASRLGRGRRRNMFRHLVDQSMEEFEVMKKHEPREEVANGEAPAHPYSAALLRGENPDEDPALVASQRLYARDYFINRMTIFATRGALPREDFFRLRDTYVRVLDPNDARLAKYRKRLLSTWIAGTWRYRQYAAMEYRSREWKPELGQAGVS